jgi:hypothetical protein
MYQINKTTNRISKLETKTFSDLRFKERENLQEWIANNPESLGEEILIIQKEFDGFNDTNERLDLLGVDKQGNIIVIENKLDDTGRDVTWQVLKYASYCSTLKKDQITKIYQDYLNKQNNNETAEENLIEFFNANDFAEISLNSGQTQRIIMVAGSFRKEVTSTVLWLMNYKLRIQCFKVTPYQDDDKLFINFEQIIPIKEVEDYVISMANKTQEDISTQEELKSRHLLRIEFWKDLLKEINKNPNSFQNCSPSKDNWIASGSGVSGVTFNFVISNYYARAELYMSKGNKDINKFIFDELQAQKEEIEKKFGGSLQWERLDDKKACRIKFELNEVDYFNRDDWEKMIAFMIEGMQRLEKSFREPIAKLKPKLKTKGADD